MSRRSIKKKGVSKMKVSKLRNKIKVVSLTDWHVPYEDPVVIQLEIDWCEAEQPEIIITHELHDFYELSKFDKDPARTHNLQDEIDKVNEYMAKLRKVCPKSRIILLNSNHLNRLKKYLWRVAPALNSLRSLKIETLLELKKYNIEYKDVFMFRGVLFKHGDLVRKFSSYTAKGEFEKESVSGSSGHTHRLGAYFHTVRGGAHVWLESGCGCKLNPEYVTGIPNWQNGFSLFCFEPKGNHFYPTVIPIIDHQIFWGNKTFDRRKR
jgi:hypothetical protein